MDQSSNKIYEGTELIEINGILKGDDIVRYIKAEMDGTKEKCQRV